MLLSASSFVYRLLYIAILLKKIQRHGAPKKTCVYIWEKFLFFHLSTVINIDMDFMSVASEACNSFGLSAKTVSKYIRSWIVFSARS